MDEKTRPQKCDPHTKKYAEIRRKPGISKELLSLVEVVNYPSSNTRSQSTLDKLASKKRKRSEDDDDDDVDVMSLCTKKKKRIFCEKLVKNKMEEIARWKKLQEDSCRAFRRHKVVVIKRVSDGTSVETPNLKSQLRRDDGDGRLPSSTASNKASSEPAISNETGGEMDVSTNGSEPSRNRRIVVERDADSEPTAIMNKNQRIVERKDDERRGENGEKDVESEDEVAEVSKERTEADRPPDDVETEEEEENPLRIDLSTTTEDRKGEDESTDDEKVAPEAKEERKSEPEAATNGEGGGDPVPEVRIDFLQRRETSKTSLRGGESKDKCDYCKDDVLYDDFDLLKQHIRQRHPYKCVKCLVDFGDAQERYQHLVNCAKFMERRKVCEFCETIIYDTERSEIRHQKTVIHQKCYRIYERAYNEGMDKLMKKLVKMGFDLDKCHAKTQEREEKRVVRREKRRRREAAESFVIRDMGHLVDQVDNVEEFTMVEEREEPTTAPMTSNNKASEVEAQVGGNEADNEREKGSSSMPATSEEDGKEKMVDEAIQPVLEDDANDDTDGGEDDVDELSRALNGEKQESTAGAILPDFERMGDPELNNSLLTEFMPII